MTGLVLPSGPINARELESALFAICGVAKSIRPSAVWVATYGYGCGIHPDLWYKPMAVHTNLLMSFLRSSIDQRIFEPGFADMSLEIHSGEFAAQVSHEGDVQISGGDELLVRSVLVVPAVACCLRFSGA